MQQLFGNLLPIAYCLNTLFLHLLPFDAPVKWIVSTHLSEDYQLYNQRNHAFYERHKLRTKYVTIKTTYYIHILTYLLATFFVLQFKLAIRFMSPIHIHCLLLVEGETAHLEWSSDDLNVTFTALKEIFEILLTLKISDEFQIHFGTLI